jgi:hypothetical protein
MTGVDRMKGAYTLKNDETSRGLTQPRFVKAPVSGRGRRE